MLPDSQPIHRADMDFAEPGAWARAERLIGMAGCIRSPDCCDDRPHMVRQLTGHVAAMTAAGSELASPLLTGKPR